MSRRGDAAVDRGPGGVLAGVAGGGHDDDTGGRGAAHGARQGVEQERVSGRPAQAQVHHPDVGHARALQHPVDAGQHIGHVADAALVEHAHVVQVSTRCHARAVGRLVAAGAGRCCRHMRAVAVGVGDVGRGPQVHQPGPVRDAVQAVPGGPCGIHTLGPAVTRQRAAELDDVDRSAHAGGAIGTEQVLVAVVDTRIQDRDAHATAVDATAGRPAAGCHRQQRVGASGGLQQAAVPRDGAVGRDVDDVAARGQRVQRGHRHHGRQRAHREVVVEDRATVQQDVKAQREQVAVVAVGVDQHLHVLPARQRLGPADRLGVAGVGRRHISAQVGGQLGVVGGLGAGRRGTGHGQDQQHGRHQVFQ